jgi:hypothetical protein
MKLLRYVIAGGVVAVLCAALDRGHARRQARAGHGTDQRTAAVEKSVQQAALLRASSEVASGEFDMQG